MPARVAIPDAGRTFFEDVGLLEALWHHAFCAATAMGYEPAMLGVPAVAQVFRNAVATYNVAAGQLVAEGTTFTELEHAVLLTLTERLVANY